MGMPLQVQRAEMLERVFRRRGFELAFPDVSPKGLRHFDIDQVRHVKGKRGVCEALPYRPPPDCAKQQLE